MFDREQWRITLIRSRPAIIGMVLFGIGLLGGMLWAYGPAGVVWQSAEPVHLEPSYQDEWVKMVAAQFAQSGDQQNATRQLSQVQNPTAIIDRLQQANAADRELVGLLTSIRPLAAQAEGGQLPEPSFFQSLGAICVIPFLIVGFIAVVLWGMYGLMLTVVVKALNPFKRRTHGTEATKAMSQMERERREALVAVKAVQEAQAVAPQALDVSVPTAPPIAQYVSAYTAGNDFFDDSFSIEDENNAFLGECGAGISETLDLETPKKVAAIEVWLFDKNDIRTVTKVVMTEYAYNDLDGLRAKLAPKGDAVLAQPNINIELETETLRVVATIVSVGYGDGAAPPNSYFGNLSLNVAAYRKEGVGSAAPPSLPDPYGGTMPVQ